MLCKFCNNCNKRKRCCCWLIHFFVELGQLQSSYRRKGPAGGRMERRDIADSCAGRGTAGINPPNKKARFRTRFSGDHAGAPAGSRRRRCGVLPPMRGKVKQKPPFLLQMRCESHTMTINEQMRNLVAPFNQ